MTNLLCPAGVLAVLALPSAFPCLAQQLPADFLVPIHSADADPLGGDYGTWAAGPDYKVSFHDGFAFHPYVPGQRTTRAFRWRTESVQAGGAELRLGSPEVASTPWRHEYRFAACTEAYEVRVDGVEQTFVFASRPEPAGELVITGLVDTPFDAAPAAARVGALEFLDAGRPALTYGAAIAIDARGACRDVRTSFDGSRIRLHVDADFVARATFPLVVDPLTRSASVSSGTVPIVETTIVCASDQGAARVVLAAVREFSATDCDAYAYLVGDTPGGAVFPVYTDVTTTWSTSAIDSAELAGAGKWALAFQRDFPQNGATLVRCYLQSWGSSTLNAGTTLFSTVTSYSPRIGGGRSGATKGLVVSGATSGGHTQIQILDGVAETLSPATLIQVFSTSWSVSRARSAAAPFCVALHTPPAASGGVSTVDVRLVDENGVTSTSRRVDVADGGFAPEVDGDAGRFVLTWQDRTNLLLRRLRAVRIDFTPTSLAVGTVRSLASVAALSTISDVHVAHDFTTRSHWAVSYHTTDIAGAHRGHVMRLGYRAGVCESAEISADHPEGVRSPCVAFSGLPTPGTWATFAISYATMPGVLGSRSLRYRTFGYDPNAGVTFYGASCSGNTLGDGHPPYAGSEFYTSNLDGLAGGTAAYLTLGLGPLNIPLDGIGMVGCNLLVDSFVAFGTVADPSGLARISLPLSDTPVFVGDLYAQWVWLAPGANALGVLNSRGIQIRVR